MNIVDKMIHLNYVKLLKTINILLHIIQCLSLFEKLYKYMGNVWRQYIFNIIGTLADSFMVNIVCLVIVIMTILHILFKCIYSL